MKIIVLLLCLLTVPVLADSDDHRAHCHAHRCDSRCHGNNHHSGHHCNLDHCNANCPTCPTPPQPQPITVTVTNTVTRTVTRTVTNTVYVPVSVPTPSAVPNLVVNDYSLQANHSYRLYVAMDQGPFQQWGILRSTSNITARVVIPVASIRPRLWQVVDNTPGYDHLAVPARAAVGTANITWFALGKGRVLR